MSCSWLKIVDGFLFSIIDSKVLFFCKFMSLRKFCNEYFEKQVGQTVNVCLSGELVEIIFGCFCVWSNFLRVSFVMIMLFRWNS